MINTTDFKVSFMIEGSGISSSPQMEREAFEKDRDLGLDTPTGFLFKKGLRKLPGCCDSLSLKMW